MNSDPRTRAVSCNNRRAESPGVIKGAICSMKYLAVTTLRTFLVNLASRTQVNLQVTGETNLSLSACCGASSWNDWCNNNNRSNAWAEASTGIVLGDFFKAEALRMIKPWIEDLLKNMLLGDRESMVKVRYRYRYAFNDYVFEILPIGATHYAIKQLVVYPIDTLYTRMVTTPNSESLNVVEHADQIFKHNGFYGFYRGFPAALLHYVVNRLAFVVFFDLLKNMLVRDPRFIPEWKHVFIHDHASLLADTLSYPLETIRSNMMADTGKQIQKYDNVLDCAKKIVNERGTAGLFKGFSIMLLRHSWKWYSQLQTYMY